MKIFFHCHYKKQKTKRLSSTATGTTIASSKKKKDHHHPKNQTIIAKLTRKIRRQRPLVKNQRRHLLLPPLPLLQERNKFNHGIINNLHHNCYPDQKIFYICVN